MFKHFFFFLILVFSSAFEEREIILAISFYGEFFSFLIFVNKCVFQWLLVQFISEFTEISGGGFFSPVFGYIYFFSLHENLFLIKKKPQTLLPSAFLATVSSSLCRIKIELDKNKHSKKINAL